MTIEQQVINLVNEELEIDEDIQVRKESRLAEDLNCDSLDMVELQMALEDVFDLEIDYDLVEGKRTFKTVQDVIDYVKEKKGC